MAAPVKAPHVFLVAPGVALVWRGRGPAAACYRTTACSYASTPLVECTSQDRKKAHSPIMAAEKAPSDHLQVGRWAGARGGVGSRAGRTGRR